MSSLANVAFGVVELTRNIDVSTCAPESAIKSGDAKFQSAPAIAGGRCPDPEHDGSGDTSFNPRPPLLAGDARISKWPPSSDASFNPRPPLLAGDAGFGGARDLLQIVSIRARHCWRAMRVSVSVNCWAAPFQSAPAFDDAGEGGDGVSIRARHCWRAMRQTVVHGVKSARFQSAPAIAGGRCPRRWSARCGPCGFNPRPAIAGGRCPQHQGHRHSHRSFNPRPPLLAGDALVGAEVAARRDVSIRARHCWRAMQDHGFCVGRFH